MQLTANLNASRYDYALQVARRLQCSLPSRVVYDIGAGEGRMKEPLQASGYRWFGFDLIPRGETTEPWDLTFPCPKDETKPSLVLLLDVIEHLANPGLALSNIAHVLA